MPEVTSESHYNRVLMSFDVAYGQAEVIETGGTNALPAIAVLEVSDPSFVALEIEHVIALGAIGIGVDLPDRQLSALKARISPLLEHRLVRINRRRAQVRAAALFQPIAQELGFRIADHFFVSDRPINGELVWPIAKVFQAMRDFLLAQQHGLQVDIDIDRVRGGIAVLLGLCRTTEARAVLSIFAGLLARYEPCSLSAPIRVSHTPEELIRLFNECVEDSTYRAMSRCGHGLGVAGKARRQAIMFSRLAERLIAKPAFRGLLTLGAKIVNAVLAIPLADADLAKTFLRVPYLPPIASVASVPSPAWERYQESGKVAIPTEFKRLE